MSKIRIVREFAVVRWLRPLRSVAAVRRRQQRLLRRQLAYLRRHSPYFRALIPDGARSLSGMPEMDKALMMAHFDQMNTVGIGREEAMELALANEQSRDFDADLAGCSVGLSSGTSGHRGLFVVSRAEREAWAGTVLARALPRGSLFGHRIALFLRADNTLYESVDSRAVAFAYFDVYDDPEANIARLEEFSPTILVAPPSVLLTIARAAEQGRFSRVPQKVYSVAEVLEEHDARRITAALRQPFLHQIYQCTEGFLAYTCRHGVIHLNEDTVLFEGEDLGQGRFTPIITDLRRRAQPIVRYRLGDVLRLREEPCPCGSVLTAIERIEGRVGDTLCLPALRAEAPAVAIFADLISRAMLYATGFGEYRVTQTGEVTWEVALDELGDEATSSVTRELERLAARLGARAPQLQFHAYDHDAGTKLRRVRQEWGDSHEAL